MNDNCRGLFIVHRSSFIVLLIASIAFCAQAGAPLRVGSIVIETLDVYSNQEARKGLVYRAADKLHIETRASVIRKFLLFREGDPYVPERLAETERNLRALHYIKAASVVALPPHDGLVDVIVSTQDAWSIAPETQAGMKGGASSYGAAISDTNVLGWGKEVSVAWDKGTDRTRLGFDFQDPMLFANYWSGHLAYGRTTDGHDMRYSVRRPFYSFAAPWSAELTDVSFLRDEKLYRDGRLSSRFRHESRQAVASWGRALSPSDSVANRLIGGFRLSRDTFDQHEGFSTFVPPPQRDYRYLFARFEHAQNDFVKLNFINKDMRYEDFNLGRQLWVEAAVSPRLLDAPVNSTAAAAGVTEGVKLAETAFVLRSMSIHSRFDGGAQNAIASGSALLVKRSGDDHPSTFVARAVINHGWRIDLDRQFFADGDTGLRGYRLHSFAGSRSIILNAEQRFYLGLELLQLASPGLVAFADAGNATYGDFRELMRLKFDVGVGIRVGLPRTPKNLLRIDLAYALNRDPLGRRGFLVSFSSGQAF